MYKRECSREGSCGGGVLWNSPRVDQEGTRATAGGAHTCVEQGRDSFELDGVD